MKNNPIGIIDSGVGGISIWKEMVTLLPQESTIYIADQKYCPYGVRDSDEIYQLSKRLVSYLLTEKVKLIILACNTITVSSLNRLREDFPDIPLIGTVPVIKTAANLTKNKKIGVLSTSRTSQSEYQKQLILEFAGDLTVLNRGTDRLVPFIERGEIRSHEFRIILQEELRPFQDAGIDTLALGCTHFPFLKKVINDILGEQVIVLDSGSAIARQAERVLRQRQERSNKGEGSHTISTTGSKQEFSSTLQSLLEKEVWSTIQDVQEIKI